jgi:methionine synthase II (cobalamin-independent)
VADVASTTLIVSITGIVVSGIVGPTTTAWASRRAARSQFLRDRAAARRDELRSLLDEACSVLGLGATRLRQAWEADQAGKMDAELQPWSERVFTIGQRLRIHLVVDDPIVVAYDTVRNRLIDASKLASLQDKKRYEAALIEFETARDQFLARSQAALAAPITADGPR